MNMIRILDTLLRGAEVRDAFSARMTYPSLTLVKRVRIVYNVNEGVQEVLFDIVQPYFKVCLKIVWALEYFERYTVSVIVLRNTIWVRRNNRRIRQMDARNFRQRNLFLIS